MSENSAFIRDAFREIDISELAPGDVFQTEYNGELIFIRKLTHSEVKETESLPYETLVDKDA